MKMSTEYPCVYFEKDGKCRKFSDDTTTSYCVLEPAYLKVFDPLLKSGWHIIKAVTKDKIIFRGWQTVYVPIDGMGVNYNLYRRPPEGES